MPEYRIVDRGELLPPDVVARTEFNTERLDELAESIRKHGIFEPLVVKPHDGKYRIIAGHRRYLAAELAGLFQIPVMVYQEQEIPSEAVQIDENLCRDELSAAEQGWLILQLVEKYQLSMDDLCRRLRRSENWINDRVALVRRDAEVAAAVARRQISYAVAKEINKCKHEEDRAYLLKQSIKHGSTAATAAFQATQLNAQREVPLVPPPAPGTQPAAAPAVDLTPHCALCGQKDSPQNLIEKHVHYYHWDPIKKFLRDSGIEVHD